MERECIMCGKKMDVEDNYQCGVSLGETWCEDCAEKEIKKNED